MRDSLTLGRIASIRFGVNWSWVIVFALIVWTLATGIFPSTNPGHDQSTYIAMAIVAALLFFTSLLMHEFGHALEAKREGVEIEGITLWLFGGVAKFKGMFPSAGAEFRIAVAGPLVSLAIGVFFVLIAWIGDLPEAVDGVVGYLGYINLVLLVFNLIPALPLDGGRVLRSILWQTKGDFRWATNVAAEVARVFAFLFIGVGLAEVFFLNSFAGVWLAFLGWFLLQAAGAEARYLATRQALGGLRVRDLMVRDPVTVAPDLSLGRFMDEVVWPHRYTSYPVVDDGRAVGLLPFRSVAQVPRTEWDGRSVRDAMLPLEDVPELTEEDDLVDALAKLGSSGVGRGLVVEDGRLAGLLSLTDLSRALEIGRPPRRLRTAG